MNNVSQKNKFICNKQNMRMKKIISYTFLGILILLVVLELILRFHYGFCDAPLYYHSDKYEYQAQPNQIRNRFGNRIYYNSFSMRSDEVDSTKVKVLGLGDSVINGGVTTDHANLASTLIGEQMGIQFLNIAVGSWGPDNCAAFLKEKGLFDAEAIVLVVSSHDAFDNMDFKPVVGVHASYPSKQYPLAIAELLGRYVFPKLMSRISSAKLDPDAQVLSGIRKEGKEFNVGFQQLKEIADSVSIPLLVYLHPERTEVENGKYNEQGTEIIKWAEVNHVPCYQGLNESLDESYYRDVIHTNDKGQQKLAEVITNMLKEHNIL